MAYIGNPPAEAYTNTVKDSFNGDGSTVAFTMSQPSVTNDVRVVVENVIQDPTVAYSCSGTTLTFTSAPPSGTNNIYVVHLGPAVMTTVPPSDIASATTFASNVTVQGAFTSQGIDDNATSTAMTLDSSNNIGIGTISPSSLLDVDQSQNAETNIALTNTNTGSSAQVRTKYTTDGGLFTVGKTSDAHAFGGDAYLYNVDNTNIRFATSDTERMRIDSSGRVGIGDVPKQSFTGHSILQVGGQAILGANDALSTTGQTYLTHNLYFDTSGNYQVFNTGGANEGTVYTQADGIHKWSNSAATTGTPSVQERMRIDSSGNLLVGTTNSSIFNASSGTGMVYRNGVALDVAREATGSGQPCVNLNMTGTDGDHIIFYKDGNSVGRIGVTSGGVNIYYAGGSVKSGVEYGSSAWIPWYNGARSDNFVDLGVVSSRFDDIYATNGTIQTSDRNEKQDIEALSDAEQRVAVACKGLLRKFRWIDAVSEKGDDARIHFGIIAQDLQDAFAVEGLDAGRYAMFISSTWWETQTEVPAVEADEENGIEAKEAYTRTDTYETLEEAPEGATERTRLGVRYPELLAFIIGAM